jgi:thiol-disulfide isomerase/thioredoxin
VNFWASWCAPCRAEFPMMNRLHQEYAARGLTIVAVNEDVREASARRFLAEFQPRFTTAIGGGKMQEIVGYRGLPFTILLDRQGRVISRFFGFGGRDQYRLLSREIERALR